jgi:hypothetical protein
LSKLQKTTSNRGILPEGMQINEEEENQEPDYVLVV